MPRIRSGTAILSIVAAMSGCSSVATTQGEQETVGKTVSALGASNVEFGTRCQQDFQNTWIATLGNVWDSCGGFNNSIASISPVKFYWNLQGAEADFEQPENGCGFACGNINTVDFLYFESHGGSNDPGGNGGNGPLDIWWTMWDTGTRAHSIAYPHNMRLGDSGRGLKVYTTKDCDTHKTDSLLWQRWNTILKGGLVEANGAHGLMYYGEPNMGGDFANRMKNEEAIGQAWLEATYYADNRNTPTILTTGHSPSGGQNDPADCWNRMGANLNSILNQTILRDGDVQTICYDNWN